MRQEPKPIGLRSNLRTDNTCKVNKKKKLIYTKSDNMCNVNKKKKLIYTKFKIQTKM